MNPKTFIRLYYIHQFFFDLIFIYAVEKLFFLSRGIDLTQIGLLLFLWSLMSLIFEVPSGVLADHWSRRKMLILSGVFFSACYITWIFSNSFIMFLFGFLLRTIGATLTSGTLQAYLYDFLKVNNKEHEFEKTLGRGNALRTLGLGTAMAFGGFFSEISYNFTLIASAASILTISVIGILWPEIKQITSTGEEGYWHFLKNSVKTVGKSKDLMRIVLYSAIVLSIFANLEEFNDVYLKFLGYPNYLIGLTFTIATIGQAIASFYAYKFKHHIWRILNMIALVGCIILILAGFVKHPLMAAGILFLGILLELSNVLNEGVIQKEIESHQRATIASLNKFVMNILPFQLLFGMIAHTYNIQWGYLIFGLSILLYFIFILLLQIMKRD